MFNPGRFLDENNNFVRCGKLIPFSVGKRYKKYLIKK